MHIIVFLQANYTDPQTKLRFSSSEEFSYIRLLPTDVVTGYLTLRKATCIVPWETFHASNQKLAQTDQCWQCGTIWRRWAHITRRDNKGLYSTELEGLWTRTKELWRFTPTIPTRVATPVVHQQIETQTKY